MSGNTGLFKRTCPPTPHCPFVNALQLHSPPLGPRENIADTFQAKKNLLLELTELVVLWITTGLPDFSWYKMPRRQKIY
jgi:hypothetical protein